jgi:hypothetical protein
LPGVKPERLNDRDAVIKFSNKFVIKQVLGKEKKLAVNPPIAIKKMSLLNAARQSHGSRAALYSMRLQSRSKAPPWQAPRNDIFFIDL